jgi:hypothetical protein
MGAPRYAPIALPYCDLLARSSHAIVSAVAVGRCSAEPRSADGIVLRSAAVHTMIDAAHAKTNVRAVWRPSPFAILLHPTWSLAKPDILVVHTLCSIGFASGTANLTLRFRTKPLTTIARNPATIGACQESLGSWSLSLAGPFSLLALAFTLPVGNVAHAIAAGGGGRPSTILANLITSIHAAALSLRARHALARLAQVWTFGSAPLSVVSTLLQVDPRTLHIPRMAVAGASARLA